MTFDYVADPEVWDRCDSFSAIHIYNARGYRTFSGGLPVVHIVTDADGFGADLIDASNFATIREELAGDETVRLATGPYCDSLYAQCDESGEPVSEAVAAVLRALEDYPIFNEYDYSEREQEYIDTNLGDALFDAFRYGDVASVAALDWATDTSADDMVTEYHQWREAVGADYPMATDDLAIPDIDLFVESINRRFA